MELIKTDLAIELEEKYNVSFTPTKGTENSAAYDIRACIREEAVIYPNKSMLIPLGFKAHIGSRYNNLAGFLLPRSGLGSVDGIVLGNLVGLIDEDYQQEWMCSVWNRNSDKRIIIKPTMKLAQLVFLEAINYITFNDVSAFSNSTSRKGGFGSTGKF